MRPEGFIPHLPQKSSNSRCIRQHGSHITKSIFSVRWIISKLIWFLDIDNGINPKSGKPFIQPPVHHLINPFPDHRIFPVQIRLLFVKYMKIIPVRVWNWFPHRTAKIRSPVTWQLPILFLLKIKIFSILTFGVCTSFPKPFMLIGTMIDHQIHHNTNPPFFCLFNQSVHIFHGSKHRINLIVICNVISLICTGRQIHRGNPYQVNPQFL